MVESIKVEVYLSLLKIFLIRLHSARVYHSIYERSFVAVVYGALIM